MRGNADLALVETVLADSVEHRRRVEERHADIPGHVPPTWQEVQDGDWVPWDQERDGSRLVIDTSDADEAWLQLLEGFRADDPWLADRSWRLRTSRATGALLADVVQHTKRGYSSSTAGDQN